MRNVSVQFSRVDLGATQFVASEGPTVIGSMSYLHIKYRNPCKVPSRKQISLSFAPALAVCLCVCASIPHGLVSVAKLIVFTSALHTLRRYKAGKLGTVESRLQGQLALHANCCRKARGVGRVCHCPPGCLSARLPVCLAA